MPKFSDLEELVEYLDPLINHPDNGIAVVMESQNLHISASDGTELFVGWYGSEKACFDVAWLLGLDDPEVI